MEFTLNAYSMVFSDHTMTKQLEYGNKILLPSSILPDIDIDSGTVYFSIMNPRNCKEIFVGVHEYNDSAGICFLPHAMLERLHLNDGEAAIVKQVKDIPLGAYIKIKPYEKAFIELSDPKAVLERFISRNYPILSKGEVIIIDHVDTQYHIEVVECKPETTIQTTNCDINVDFEKPVDMIEEEEQYEVKKDRIPSPPPVENTIIRRNPIAQETLESFRTKEDLIRFPGVGRRLGSK